MPTFYERVKLARSPEEVLSASRAFLASWDKQTFAKIPDHCQPNIASRDDISRCALVLKREREEIEASAQKVPLAVQVMGEFLERAAERLRELERESTQTAA